MTNIRITNGLSKENMLRKIRDMEPGEFGYTVEEAVRKGSLDEDCFIDKESGGTVDMLVHCVAKGQYDIEYAQGGIPSWLFDMMSRDVCR